MSGNHKNKYFTVQKTIIFRSFSEGVVYQRAKQDEIDIDFAIEGKFRYPDVPDEEMKIVKEELDSDSKYALSVCTRSTLLLVGSEKIPPCYY